MHDATTSYLRLCCRCNRNFAAHAARYFDEPYWCPTCHKQRMEGFDPQPHDEVIPIGREGKPFSTLLVRSRDGDQVTAWPVGWEAEHYMQVSGQPITWHVRELLPYRKAPIGLDEWLGKIADE